jgi:ribosome-binding protein aMBF1 (putative translation factor)
MYPGNFPHPSSAETLGIHSAISICCGHKSAQVPQEQVAKAMGTTQAVIARLESGKVLPSTRTLERFAKATRTRLRISFAREALSPEASR